MRSSIQKTYFFFVALPDRLYPFASDIEGQWVRGRLSYEQAVARALETYGIHRLGYKLTIYREAFHFAGSVIFIAAAAVLSKLFLGSDQALYVLSGAAILAIAYQEFYLHPKWYGQRLQKGILDWVTWVAPIAAYLFLIK